MKDLPGMIVSDKDNRKYWEASTLPARIVLDKDLPFERIDQKCKVILVDISIINDLFEAIRYIQANQPGSRIIVVHATPTWKFIRAVLESGASDLIRKTSHPDEIFKRISSLTNNLLSNHAR